MFQFQFEEATGILVLRVTGEWTVDEINRYQREAAEEYPRIRARTGHLRLLIDRTEAEDFTPEQAQTLRKAIDQIAADGDRVARVVRSSLSKAHTKQLLANDSQTFLSEQAARTWLTAFDSQPLPPVSVVAVQGAGGAMGHAR